MYRLLSVACSKVLKAGSVMTSASWRWALSTTIAALLAGCGVLRQAQDDMQPPIGALGAMPQSRASLRQDNANASQYRVVFRFPSGSGLCPDGAWPWGGLLMFEGTLYGTTYAAGAYGAGTVFSVDAAGKLHLLHSFEQTGEGEGGGPEGALVAVNGTLYGTTAAGGKYRGGTVFGITTDGRTHVLHSFGKNPDGATPQAALLAVNGVMFGTTSAGGAYGDGTVFSIMTNGTSEKVLHSFGSGSDGQAPQASLIAVKGALFGTTAAGGRHGDGTVFRMSLNGTRERVLHSFAGGSDGKTPNAALTAVNDVLYGTTSEGGAYGQTNWGGTLFSIRTSGEGHRVLHSFAQGTDGQKPVAALIRVNGVLYGTTALGGAYARSSDEGGTLYSFEISNGEEHVLHSFGRRSDGSIPVAPVAEMGGTVYGATIIGGIDGQCVASGGSGNGTLFAFRP
jgi:uncharacterized repeat protein (TIGR03803 family)